MTKSEFLAQENVPEFIKAIVSNLPGDADVEIESFKLGKPPKKESCSCDQRSDSGSNYLTDIDSQRRALEIPGWDHKVRIMGDTYLLHLIGYS